MPRLTAHLLLAATVATVACGGGTKPPVGPVVTCQQYQNLALAAGTFAIIDPTVQGGCISLPAAGASGAEHLVVALSGAGQEALNGVSAGYALNGLPVAVAAAPRPAPPAGALPFAEVFHDRLRQREQALGRQLSATPALRAAPRPFQGPPVVGSKAVFNVCADQACGSFVQVQATAKFVGTRGAIFLDDTVPGGGYSQTDIDQIGALFDGPAPNMYGIDTTAFGRESDLDGNSVVIILLTDQVNKLSGACNQTGSAVLGFFFGNDLTNNTGSNHGEIFYGLVPDPNNTTCTISKNYALGFLPPVFIHEFHHMISFNQHVLVRGGFPPSTWLDEALSHFAEELGGRQLGAGCPTTTSFANCLQQFGFGDLSNARAYLMNPEAFYLIEPGNSFGTLEERGANWLFIRWLGDHLAADPVLATDLTRKLTQTSKIGYLNVEAATGTTFPTLVSQWQLANYLEHQPTVADTSGRLRYSSWDLDSAFTNPPLGGPYPLVPDPAPNGQYAHTGIIRGGSGHHVLVTQTANAAAIDLQITGSQSFSTAVPRLVVFRIR